MVPVWDWGLCSASAPGRPITSSNSNPVTTGLYDGPVYFSAYEPGLPAQLSSLFSALRKCFKIYKNGCAHRMCGFVSSTPHGY